MRVWGLGGNGTHGEVREVGVDGMKGEVRREMGVTKAMVLKIAGVKMRKEAESNGAILFVDCLLLLLSRLGESGCIKEIVRGSVLV